MTGALAWRWAALRGDRRALAADGATAFAQARAFGEQGGLAFILDLAPVPRRVRLVVQPDGDVLLLLPRDYGSRPEDAGQFDAWIGTVGEALRRMGGVPLPALLAWPLALAELGLPVAAGAMAVRAVLAEPVEALVVSLWPWAVAAVAPWLFRLGLRAARPVIMRRLGRAIRGATP